MPIPYTCFVNNLSLHTLLYIPTQYRTCNVEFTRHASHDEVHVTVHMLSTIDQSNQEKSLTRKGYFT